ncbi:MAG: D-2-hydroxyacid dehydrogenase [Burkholderiales bacterium]|nr:D-2-hydroxyacid dehydrogenase [Burkholderiales bacterium]
MPGDSPPLSASPAPTWPDNPRIWFVHKYYDLEGRAQALKLFPGVRQVRSAEALVEVLPDADVLVVSGMWQPHYLDLAPRLRFIQSISSGVEFFDTQALIERGIRLASASGVNAIAVAEHALALMLALIRRLHVLLDNQRKHLWRAPATRPGELSGKTVLVIGTGSIGAHLSSLLCAFGCRVVGLRRTVSAAFAGFDEIHAFADLAEQLPRADLVVLACPLTDETRHLINAAALAQMRPSAMLINVARGGCVDEAALAAALRSGRIAGAAIDVAQTEPLAPDSPLWDLPELIITPHLAGDTPHYEDRVLAIFSENLQRLRRGEVLLQNQVC